ncbi:SDR family NAD(P)-dependent oxidoreductase [Alteraurantiacibacter aquimixticola]|uniref:SDR family NAD(P)-dependent oxidoreductase n=1 Tax=Alteraurantiacibacter aquimixticola TaxID=2489173 RepID=A0A4T3F2K8_9SPHN|nr:SDR family NAD(P)-dependent oxidoreductase [Alteraurantiacibacter aquimixticola]TIX50931.1 SDR family NAD(P)-dependent oxidoreductase [Alteraurantiacibacter aquimixticola]
MSSIIQDTAAPLALITGASSGIGQAFARRLGAEGYNLIAIGRRRERLDALVTELANVEVRPIVADLGIDAGVEVVADLCAAESLTMLVNNAGVAHYMPFTELPAQKAAELLQVKTVAPTMLSRAAVPGMVARQSGAIINVSGMLAYGASAPLGPAPGRATYVATLAHLVALSQALHEELKGHGVRVQALCPGIVATEFHERQGMDLSALPRMSPEDVVTASLRGLELGEVVCAPGVERVELLDAAQQANLAAFAGQSPQLAQRYRDAKP